MVAVTRRRRAQEPASEQVAKVLQMVQADQRAYEGLMPFSRYEDGEDAYDEEEIMPVGEIQDAADANDHLVPAQGQCDSVPRVVRVCGVCVCVCVCGVCACARRLLWPLPAIGFAVLWLVWRHGGRRERSSRSPRLITRP